RTRRDASLSQTGVMRSVSATTPRVTPLTTPVNSRQRSRRMPPTSRRRSEDRSVPGERISWGAELNSITWAPGEGAESWSRGVNRLVGVRSSRRTRGLATRGCDPGQHEAEPKDRCRMGLLEEVEDQQAEDHR